MPFAFEVDVDVLLLGNISSKNNVTNKNVKFDARGSFHICHERESN